MVKNLNPVTFHGDRPWSKEVTKDQSLRPEKISKEEQEETEADEKTEEETEPENTEPENKLKNPDAGARLMERLKSKAVEETPDVSTVEGEDANDSEDED